jgi:seryl-tRNA synthetase
MLDIRRIREQPEEVRAGLRRKGAEIDLEKILALDRKRRDGITSAEELRGERNRASKEIGQRKKAGEDIAPQAAAVKELGARISEIESELKEIEAALEDTLLRIPNAPHPGVPDGADAGGNVEIRRWGKPREFSFTPRPHWELGERLGAFDFERGAKMTGAGFPLFTGVGARLERALIQFMLDLHVSEHGYTEIAPPFLCHTASMTGTGQLPKMAEDMYRLQGEDLWLVPTAEVPVTNLYRDEIIERDLPIYLTAYTPCFRREAGAAGRDTRGLIRVHQFDKVEMVKFVEPDKSYEELESLVLNAEDVLQRLDLPYRVIELCAGDLSFAAAKCYDIELWAPAHQGWLEVSSCSNFEDFQARRAGIRYREEDGKPATPHTLNGSGVALPRLMVALLETFQEQDGSVPLPEALWPYMGGVKKLDPPA